MGKWVILMSTKCFIVTSPCYMSFKHFNYNYTLDIMIVLIPTVSCCHWTGFARQPNN